MTKLYDKCDAFGFHIVNFPFMSSNIPSAPAYGVYTSQLIHYAHCCSNYSDFLLRHRALVTRLLSQGYKVKRNFNSCLSKTLKKRQKSHRINNLYATSKKFRRQLPIVPHCWKIIYNLWLECSPVLEMNLYLVQ